MVSVTPAISVVLVPPAVIDPTTDGSAVPPVGVNVAVRFPAASERMSQVPGRISADGVPVTLSTDPVPPACQVAVASAEVLTTHWFAAAFVNDVLTGCSTPKESISTTVVLTSDPIVSPASTFPESVALVVGFALMRVPNGITSGTVGPVGSTVPFWSADQPSTFIPVTGFTRSPEIETSKEPSRLKKVRAPSLSMKKASP